MNNYNQSNNLDCINSEFSLFKKNSLAKRITSILAGAAIGTLAATHAYAQEDQAQPQAEESENFQLEEVIITGIRHSYTSALDRKREAGTMMDSIVAEDISEFPDKNIGEALQRISGIQLERDMGEGTSVSVRGVESGLVRVELNGVTAMGMGGSRSVDFRDMASELVKSIDVYKGSEARLTEGGVGGTIQINTRKPNEFDENFLSINGEAQYNTMIDEVMPKYNLTGVYKVTDKFGVLVNITGSEVHTMLNGLRNTNWQKYHDVDMDPNKTSIDQLYADYSSQQECMNAGLDAAGETACLEQWYEYSPSTPRYSIWGREEDRLSANIELQYQLTDHWSFDVSYTDSSRHKVATDRNFQVEVGSAFNLDSAVVDGDKNVVQFVTNGVNAAGTPIGATIRNRTLNFDWDQEREVMHAGFDYINDNWKIDGYIARSSTFEDIDSRDTQSAQNNVGGIVVTQVGELPEIDFTDAYIINQNDENDTFDTFNYNDGTQYTSLDRFKYSPYQNEASENIAQVDLIYSPEDSFFKAYRTGFIATDQDFANNSWGYNLMQTVGNPYTVDGETRVWTQDDHEAVLVDNRFATDMFFRDYDLDVDVIESYMAIDTDPYLNTLLERSGYSSAEAARGNLQPIDSRYNINVQTQSAYVQADFETDIGSMILRGNFGVRVARTETASEGFTRIRVLVEQTDESGNPIYGPNGEDLAGVEDPDDPRAFEGRQTVEEDFVDVLPSLNLTLEMMEGLEAYVGVAKVMARPNINDLNINADCTLRDYPLAVDQMTPNTCTAGNPDLDPYRATQGEVALTWYPNDASILSAAYFVKDITSYIFGAETQQDVDFFNDGTVWDVRQQVNKEGITTKGFEIQASTFFDFLPGFLSNTGAKANYTYITADNVDDFNPLTGEQMPLRGQSENSYNLEAFYEDESWSIKLAYNYRDEFYSRVFDGLPVFVDASGYIDGKIAYTLNENLKFYVDARNLGREVKLETSGPGRTNDLQWSGRAFSLGFTYRM
ncbi:TonB-dependent receptor [Gilvimarinus sp. SDUM040013]|uniref:TonB-dependent receptor n=1 Tax=Gilvimarinus gilvus TaxID=3058038 RepID=A0ABU4RX33_9GAMM|nr:TonB-dependent receptor [Gilvimarinus sp. SDUM040013]MDO3386666.1 TonB-dependent receptor [Gilvimarinus sp. SDUM040013]MDX6849447.1 TonB-dependent receptor [Gilvimarinus sp. SDUM040013]